MIMPLIAVLAATAPPASALPVCQTDKVLQADETRYQAHGGAPLHRLDQLPPANLILTVLRTTGNCTTPVIVRYGIGQRAQ